MTSAHDALDLRSHEQAKDIEDAGAMYLKLFYRLNHMTMRTFISVSLLLFEPPSFSNVSRTGKLAWIIVPKAHVSSLD